MARDRTLLCLVLISPLLITCQTVPIADHRPGATPMIDPLPIPDAPMPRIRVPRSEPNEIALIVEDSALVTELCRSAGAVLPPSDTLYGHLRHAQAPADALVPAPPILGGGSCQQVHEAVAGPLAQMIAAARAEAPAVGHAIMAISCFRPVERQAALFCDDPRVGRRGYAGQARWIAPPGYSEHATGLSIDFGSRDQSGCNLRPCFAETRVGRWLAANAARFGFEMSFPPANVQGVSYEPWHYRYVGPAFADRRGLTRTAAPVR